MRTRHGRRFTPGVRSVLVMLALLPLVGLCWSSVRSLDEALDKASAAEEIAVRSERLSTLTSFDSALSTESYWAGAMLSTTALGVTPELVSQLIGIDLEQEYSRSRAVTDDALQAANVSDIGVILDAARAKVGEEGTTGVMADAAYLEVKDQADAAVASEVEGLNDLVGTVADARSATTAISALQASMDVREHVSAMTSRYFAVRYPSQAALSEPLDQLLEAWFGYRSASSELSALMPQGSSATETWETVRSDPQVLAFLERIDLTRDAGLGGADASAVPGLAALDLQAEADAFFNSLAAVELHVDVVDAAAQHLRGEADRLGAAADRRLRSVLVATSAMAAATIIALVLATRWIVRPLRALAAGVDSLREGQLGGEVRASGPWEVRSAAGALNEAVGHLKLAEQQAQALAREDLEDPILDCTTPGELGASLQTAVGSLTTSLAEREEFRQRLRHEATHDGLTGLPNRAAAMGSLTSALARVRRAESDLAVLLIDVDGFKSVNDRCGHTNGDRVLRRLAKRIVGATRAGDQVVRLGSDEFAVIAEPVRDLDEAVALAERIQAQIAEPIVVEDEQLRLVASVGLAMAVSNDLSADELLRDADLAVSKAKEHGGGHLEVCDVELRRELATRANVESALRQAMVTDELVVHYQPLVDSGSGEVVALEALVRWDRPGEGLIPPNDFIPIAERSDLIVELDRWVLRSVSSQLAAWGDHPILGTISVAVNVSARHLAGHSLAREVLASLEAAGVPPHRLTIEITESVLLDDLDGAAHQLAQLRGSGVRIAIDDFGTGYTSLAHLRQLPVDVLKIDRSFTGHLDRPAEHSLVQMMVDTGHLLGLAVTAEGVETAEQAADLVAMGADRLQGFHFAKPLAASELERSIVDAPAASSSGSS